MSLRAKLATTIAALCMVICLLTVGVWAAQSATVNLSGKVTFVANDVYATVSVVTSGHEGDSVSKSVTFNSGVKGEGETNVVTGGEALWNEDFDFSFKNKAPIVFTFTITNHGERKASVEITPTAAADANIALAVKETTATKTDGTLAAEGGEATYTVTMTIKDTNTAFEDVDYSIAVVLQDLGANA